MSLSLALNTALTGLRVNQQTMALISNNIANANTEGYSRQVVDLESINLNGVGGGVRIEDVSRTVDEYLQTSIYRQTSNLGYSEAVTEYYESLQILLGDPALGNSIDEHISTFFNDLQQMAETPERSSTRAAVMESATIMAREISNLALGIEQLRFQAEADLSNSIQVVNQKLEELFFVNEALAEADAFGNPQASLLDQRDLLLEEISDYIDIRVNDRKNGTVDVYIGDGINLIDFGYSELTYTEIKNINTLIEDGEINPITVQNLDVNGNSFGSPINIVSGGRSSQVETRFDGGKLAGLLAVRDEILPNMLEQLDALAAQIRDSFNEVHNQGSGYPAASELEATALYGANQRSFWEGSIRLAALNDDGTPVTSPFNDEASGWRPLNMDLTSLYNGQTFGEPDVQIIIDEINSHFGVPQNRMSVGNLNNIEMALVSNTVPASTPPSIEFDFDIENISGRNADFWVDSIQVLDDGAVDITSTTNTMPTIALHPTSTFITTAASTTVTVTTALDHGLSDGDMVRLNNPGGPVDGIPAANFDGYFTITNVTSNSFEVTVATPAVAGATNAVAAQTMRPPYDTIAAGEKTRLQQNGTISANVSANASSSYYDVNVDMVIRDADGTLSTTTVTYRVLNPQSDTMNDRIAARAVTAGSGVVTTPDNLTPILRALLVDEDGNELANTSGNYGEQEGYLKIISMRDGVTFALDDSTTRNLGLPSDVPPREGNNRKFSHHFGLNNFFTNNELIDTGDTTKNSALNLAIESRLKENPSLISTGNLQISNQPAAGSGLDPLYTYERFSGDHSIAQQLAGLGIQTQTFAAAGALPTSTLTFSAYAGEMLGYIASNTIAAERTADNDNILLDAYEERADAISGVNLDEELANTVIYQNAYSASARVITITDELFETLLGAF